MERSTVRPCLCEAVERAGMNLQFLGLFQNLLLCRRTVLYQLAPTLSSALGLSKTFQDDHLKVYAIFSVGVVLIVVTNYVCELCEKLSGHL